MASHGFLRTLGFSLGRASGAVRDLVTGPLPPVRERLVRWLGARFGLGVVLGRGHAGAMVGARPMRRLLGWRYGMGIAVGRALRRAETTRGEPVGGAVMDALGRAPKRLRVFGRRMGRRVRRLVRRTRGRIGRRSPVLSRTLGRLSAPRH